MERSISTVTGLRRVPDKTTDGSARQSAQANCPFCSGAKGFVRGVCIKGDQQTLTFVCADCKRTWDAAPVTISYSYAWPPRLVAVKRAR